MWLRVCIQNIHLCTHMLYTLYIQRGYKHMYIQSVIQAYKSVHSTPVQGPGLDTHKCPLGGGTGEEARDPVYKRLRPLCCEERLTLQTDIKVKTFSESHSQWGREVGPWRMWVAALPCWAFPGWEGSSLQSKDVHIRCHL